MDKHSLKQYPIKPNISEMIETNEKSKGNGGKGIRASMPLTLLCLLQVAVCCICLFVILPLNLVGTILGRNLSGQPNFPCRVNAVPRPIPEKKWWASAKLGVVEMKWQNLKPESGHTHKRLISLSLLLEAKNGKS